MKFVITGGFGSGKSCVTNVLSNLISCYSLSADEICHQQLEPGCEGWQAVKDSWGVDYFLIDGSLNKPKVKERIFAADEAKLELEGILHPLVFREIDRHSELANSNSKHLIVEIPLFFESNYSYAFDNVIVVATSKEKAIQRACRRDSIAEDLAGKIVASQIDIKTKCAKADWVINNDGLFAASYNQLLFMLAELKL